MIHLISGRQGSGKTLLMSKIAYENYLKGKKIISNINFNFPFEVLDYQKVVDCKYFNACIFLDEIHQLLPSRRSMRKENQLICDGFMSMVRKAGLEVYGSVQIERKVDVRIREEKDITYFCQKYAYIKGTWQEIISNENLSRNIPIIVNVQVCETFSDNVSSFWFYGNPYFKLYDTNQIIKVKELKV